MKVRAFAGVHLVPVALAPLLLVGFSLGAGAGWLIDLVALLLMGAVLRRMQPGLAAARVAGPSALGRAPKALLSAMGLLAALVFLAALAGAVGDLLIAFPAAVWTLPLVLLAALLRGRAKGVGIAILVALVPVCGLLGDDFERAGSEARGWAHSGPIAGIHPFQITAIKIDGHGPFDIPFNDYVEPDGSRGYGPTELAENLERTLRALAEVHFSDGPARARAAFAGARVELGEVPQLYDAEINPISIGFRVDSGTHGDRSRVEFVCPGQVADPRPAAPDSVMRNACPDKYASEASAGLGVTGRWPGYSEARGNARLSLARLVGRARTDDAPGRSLVRWERGAWAILVLLGMVLAHRRREVVANVTSLAGGVGLLALAAAFSIVVADVAPPTVRAIEDPKTLGFAAFVAGLAGAAGLAIAGGDRHDRDSYCVAAAVGGVAMGTAWALSSPAAAVWLSSPASPVGLVRHAADAVSLQTDLDVQALEACFAAMLVAVIGGAVVLGFDALSSVSRGWPKRTWSFAVVAVGAVALSLTGPLGHPALLSAAGLTAATASAMALVGRRQGGTRSRLDAALHGGVVILAALTGLEAAARTGATPVAMGVAIACGALALGSLAIVPSRARPGLREASESEA